MIEATCDACDGQYHPWSADNELWNEVMSPDDGTMLCPTCFMAQFDEPGLVFRVSVRVRHGRVVWPSWMRPEVHEVSCDCPDMTQPCRYGSPPNPQQEVNP